MTPKIIRGREFQKTLAMIDHHASNAERRRSEVNQAFNNLMAAFDAIDAYFGKTENCGGGK